MSESGETHGDYADEYRTDWDKKPFPPSKSDSGPQTPAPQIRSEVCEEFFTGVGEDVDPAEVGARGLDGFESHPQPIEGVNTPESVPQEMMPPANQRAGVDEEYFTGTGEGVEPPEIGAKGQDGFDKTSVSSRRTMPREERMARL